MSTHPFYLSTRRRRKQRRLYVLVHAPHEYWSGLQCTANAGNPARGRFYVRTYYIGESPPLTMEPKKEEEPYDAWACRVYTEAADKQGVFVGFMVWCMANHYDIVQEFNEYDRQMRETGIFVSVMKNEN